jgi:hypothetical protein
VENERIVNLTNLYFLSGNNCTIASRMSPKNSRVPKRNYYVDRWENR